ncbi:MAG: hydrogenase maturation protease [Clostridia bacterium]|nr:hydrogenase maturation protease [Clostridia bacterium]
MVVVIGCGNPLAGDDGVGLKVIEELEAGGLPAGTKVMAIGLPGLGILELLAGFEQAVIVDAVWAGREPGTVLWGEQESLRGLNWRHLSLHGIGIGEALELARILKPEDFPQKIYFVGVQIAGATPGAGLSPEVEAAIPRAASVIRELLKGKKPCMNYL